MSREKPGYRDTLALLNERFPDKDLLSRSDVAAFMGVTTATVRRRGIVFNAVTRRVSKADLARQVSV